MRQTGQAAAAPEHYYSRGFQVLLLGGNAYFGKRTSFLNLNAPQLELKRTRPSSPVLTRRPGTPKLMRGPVLDKLSRTPGNKRTDL